MNLNSRNKSLDVLETELQDTLDGYSTATQKIFSLPTPKLYCGYCGMLLSDPIEVESFENTSMCTACEHSYAESLEEGLI